MSGPGVPARRTAAILNPAAGRARRYACVAEEMARLCGAGLHRTAGPGHAAELAVRAVRDGADQLVVAGGDGTIHEVVNGLSAAVDGPLRMGFVPLGTGNDLCRSLDLPLDPHDALSVLRTRSERSADLMAAEVDGHRRLAVTFALGGLAGDIALHVTDERKRLWGGLVYLRGALECLRGLRSYRTELLLDGERLAPLDLLAVVVANGRCLGGGIPAAPRAVPDDGLLDVVAVHSCPPHRLPALLASVLSGRHLDDPRVLWCRARRVEVRPEPGMPFNLDGQPLGSGSAAFEVLPGALRVAAPPA